MDKQKGEAAYGAAEGAGLRQGQGIKGDGTPARKEELMRFLSRHKRPDRDAEKSAQQAQPSSNFHAYKAEFQGTILRIYVPKDLDGRSPKDAVRFQLGGDNGIGKALELGNSRSSFKGNRDKIKEGKNLMSVISLGDALSFLDRTTKDRGRAQAMKLFLQEDILPKLERAELSPWTGALAPGPSIPGLGECLRRLLGVAEKLEHVLNVAEASSYLEEVRSTMAHQVERDITVVLVGEPGSGKSHLGNRLVCPGSSGSDGPFPVGTRRGSLPFSVVYTAVRHMEHLDPNALRVALKVRSAEDYQAVLEGQLKSNGHQLGMQERLQLGGQRNQDNLLCPAIPELLGGLFSIAEVEGIPGGPFAKMQYISSQLPSRLSELQMLAVEVLAFESPAVNLPPRFTLIDTSGVVDATRCRALQMLVSHADVIIPCMRTRGITEDSLRSFVWDGIFDLRHLPILMLSPEYVAQGGENAAAPDAPDLKRALLLHSDDAWQRRASYYRRLVGLVKNPKLVPHVDIEQRLRLSEHIEDKLEVLPPGMWSLGDHRSLQSLLMQNQNRNLLWAASSYVLLVNGILKRKAFHVKEVVETPDTSSDGLAVLSEEEEVAPISEGYWANVVRQCELSFAEALKAEILHSFEEARTEVQDYVEDYAWEREAEGIRWTPVANYIIGVLRQMFKHLGKTGCALRLEAQKAAISLFVRECNSLSQPEDCEPDAREEGMYFVAASQNALARLWEDEQSRGLEALLGFCNSGSSSPQLSTLVREELRQAWGLHSSYECSGDKLNVAGFAEEAASRFFNNGNTLSDRLRSWAEGPFVAALNEVAARMVQPLRQVYRVKDDRRRTMLELGRLSGQLQELGDCFLSMRSQLIRRSVKCLPRVGDCSRRFGKIPLPSARGSEECSRPRRKLKAVPSKLLALPELEWICEMRGLTAPRDITRPYAWVEYTHSPLKGKPLRVGAWADRSINWYEHLCRHLSNGAAEVCPPTFFISKEPFSEAALSVYQQFQASAYPQEFDASQVSSGEMMALAFVIVEKRHINDLPPGFQLPTHTWPLVLPDNSHPAEYCEAAKIMVEIMMNFGLNSYALVPTQLAVHEFVGDGPRSMLSSLVRALQFGQSILGAERGKIQRRVADCMLRREFKTELINLALDDAFATPEGRDAFRRFNRQYDTMVAPDGSLQGSIEDLIDPLLPKVKERLENLLEELKMVSCVSFAQTSFAQQRQLLASPSNYCSGEPPSLVTLCDIESQAPFSFCIPGILDEVLVPPSCGEEEFLQQWRTVQKLFYKQLRASGRRCLWTAQFNVQSMVSRAGRTGLHEAAFWGEEQQAALLPIAPVTSLGSSHHSSSSSTPAWPGGSTSAGQHGRGEKRARSALTSPTGDSR